MSGQELELFRRSLPASYEEVHVDAQIRLWAAEQASAQRLLGRANSLGLLEALARIPDEIRQYVTNTAEYVARLPFTERTESVPNPLTSVLRAIISGVRFDPHAEANPERQIPEGAQVIAHLTEPTRFHLVHHEGAYAGLVAGRPLTPIQARDVFQAFLQPAADVYEMAKDRAHLTDDGRGRIGIRDRQRGDPRSSVTSFGRRRSPRQ